MTRILRDKLCMWLIRHAPTAITKRLFPGIYGHAMYHYWTPQMPTPTVEETELAFREAFNKAMKEPFTR